MMRPDAPLLWDDAALAGGAAPAWAAGSVSALRAKLTDPFPCVFAATAHVTIALAGGVDDLDRIRRALEQWIAFARNRAPDDAARMVLAVILAPATPGKTEEAFAADTWRILQYLHDHDERPWPAEVPINPANPLWSFCFDGEAIFVNASSPAHIRRRSRNLGPGLVLVIQTRAGIDLLAPPDQTGDAIRRIIRARTHAYDEAPVLPMFGPSGRVSDRDWKIIVLPDGAGSIPARCPLRIDRAP